jgi:hypothetical protein
MKNHKIIMALATMALIVLTGQAAQAKIMPFLAVPVSAIPEPSTWLAGALLLVPLGVSAVRAISKKK